MCTVTRVGGGQFWVGDTHKSEAATAAALFAGDFQPTLAITTTDLKPSGYPSVTPVT